MLRSVLGKTLWDQRRGLIGWSIGIVGFVLLSLAFYPSIKANASQFQDLMDQLPAGLRTLFLGELTDITSPVGYLNGRLFATTMPALFLVFTISAGTRGLAGEEEAHTLDVLLSMPVTRRRVLLEKTAALLIALAGLCLVVWASVLLFAIPFDLDIGAGAVGAATLHLFAFAAVFGILGLVVGGLTGRRGMSGGITTAVAVAAFVLASLAPLAASTNWLRYLSPVEYYSGRIPLLHGIDRRGIGVLVGISVVLTLLGLRAFDRRDLRA